MSKQSFFFCLIILPYFLALMHDPCNTSDNKTSCNSSFLRFGLPSVAGILQSSQKGEELREENTDFDTCPKNNLISGWEF